MELPPPQNYEEAAFMAYAMMAELINLLVAKQIIGDSEVRAMLGNVVSRLNAEPDFFSQRAANVLSGAIEVEE